MNEFSEIIGSFIRTGSYPLEANYYFDSEADLLSFYREPINRTTLHKGLLKVVGNQDLYWVAELEGQLYFKKLISISTLEDIKNNEVYIKNIQDILDRYQAALDTKADINDLSNVLSEEVIGEPLLEEINTLTREEIKKDLFIDMWRTKGGPDKVSDYNEETGLFRLYDIDDIDYEEALRIDMLSGTPYVSRNKVASEYDSTNNPMSQIAVRTLFPIGLNNADCNNMFNAKKDLEVLSFTGNHSTAVVAQAAGMFSACIKLRRIIGRLLLRSTKNAFDGCVSLEEVTLHTLQESVSFADSPKLSLASLQYLVANAANTTPITITVHPDVYAKLTDEGNAEWHALIEQAAEKNIMFTTTS